MTYTLRFGETKYRLSNSQYNLLLRLARSPNGGEYVKSNSQPLRVLLTLGFVESFVRPTSGDREGDWWRTTQLGREVVSAHLKRAPVMPKPVDVFNWAKDYTQKHGKYPLVADVAKHFKCSVDFLRDVVESCNDARDLETNAYLGIGVGISIGNGFRKLPACSHIVEAYTTPDKS